MTNKGVKIFCYPEMLITNRIYKSNGIEVAKGLYKDYYYDDYTFKACKPWRPLNSNEIKNILLESSNNDHRSNIGLIKIPCELKQIFIKLGISNVDSYDDLTSLRKQKAELYKSLVANLGDFLSNYLISDDDIETVGFIIKRGDIETATIGNGKYAGLHVDSWDDLPVSKTDINSTNRICINLGNYDRYLLFIDLTLKEMYEKLKLKDKLEIDEYNASELAYEFLNRNMRYPVYKLRVKPYEAYIAPTENIIHDGSTVGVKSSDITFTTRGHFKLGL